MFTCTTCSLHAALWKQTVSDFSELRRRQLDAQLRQLARVREVKRPDSGWLRTIREALGMSMRQLADRVGLTKSAIAALEKREAEGRITLESLSRMADAMDSEVVYFVIPRRSLQDTMRTHARELARGIAEEVDGTMALELQRTSVERREQLIDDLTEEILSKESKLWDV